MPNIDRILENIYSVIAKVSKISSIVAGFIILVMAGVICVEVFARKLFAFSLLGVEEYSSYSMAIINTWAFSYTLLRKSHIRIDLFYHNISEHVRRIFDLLSLFSLTVFAYFMGYYSFKTFFSSLIRHSKSNTILRTPLWIPQLLWFAGISFFAITLTLLFIKLFKHIKKRECNEAAKLFEYGSEGDNRIN